MAGTEHVIGFVGIGNMGAPMVRCLSKAGFSVRIYDTRSEAASACAAEAPNITVANGLAEVGQGLGTVITMLPDSKIVRLATLGSDTSPGFARNMLAGGLIIDMSSSYPIDTQMLAKDLARLDLKLIDAPVSGGVPKAKAGTLAIMAGGDASLIDRAEPALKAMGSIHRTGPLGSGHAMKALNNYVSVAGLIASCEALLVGAKFGLDPSVMTKVLNASTGRNNTTENKLAQYIISRTFGSGFSLALMNKDVGMAASLAKELGIKADELAFCAELLAKAAKALGPGADHTAIMKFLEPQGK